MGGRGAVNDKVIGTIEVIVIVVAAVVAIVDVVPHEPGAAFDRDPGGGVLLLDRTAFDGQAEGLGQSARKAAKGRSQFEGQSRQGDESNHFVRSVGKGVRGIV